MSDKNPTKPKCPYCGSNNIINDANASWDHEQQKYVLEGVMDTAYCCDCEADDINEDWVPLDDNTPGRYQQEEIKRIEDMPLMEFLMSNPPAIITKK